MLIIFSKVVSGVCNNFSTSNFSTSSSIAIFNIPDKNVLSSSVHFYQFSFSFNECFFFINSVFYNIFNVNSVTNILKNLSIIFNAFFS